ncbi:uncharacterized protein lbhl [Scomber scombrus]|uniref:uncharacterized protein lbhl n=1 Tax=Scomber scombrus TaxID=13677 RepID=UPI002DDB3404|nr:uncharacterized protein lbhl [Scomber scombrus]
MDLTAVGDINHSSPTFIQIFPDPVEIVLGPETSLNILDHDHEKERLPSIVVEPTDLSEVESGELRWPPDNMDVEEDEEDLFLEQCIPPANIADWGDEEEEEEEETSVILNQQPGLTLIGKLDVLSYCLPCMTNCGLKKIFSDHVLSVW